MSISPSSESSGLVSFRIGWFDLLAVHGTLKSLHQDHSLKASILQLLAFRLAPGQMCPLLKQTQDSLVLFWLLEPSLWEEAEMWQRWKAVWQELGSG